MPRWRTFGPQSSADSSRPASSFPRATTRRSAPDATPRCGTSPARAARPAAVADRALGGRRAGPGAPRRPAVRVGAGGSLDQGLARARVAAQTLTPIEVVTTTVGQGSSGSTLGRFDLGASSMLLLFIFLTSMTSAVALIETRRLDLCGGCCRRPRPWARSWPARASGDSGSPWCRALHHAPGRWSSSASTGASHSDRRRSSWASRSSAPEQGCSSAPCSGPSSRRSASGS